jgi:hypothetical protein
MTAIMTMQGTGELVYVRLSVVATKQESNPLESSIPLLGLPFEQMLHKSYPGVGGKGRKGGRKRENEAGGTASFRSIRQITQMQG